MDDFYFDLLGHLSLFTKCLKHKLININCNSEKSSLCCSIFGINMYKLSRNWALKYVIIK